MGIPEEPDTTGSLTAADVTTKRQCNHPDSQVNVSKNKSIKLVIKPVKSSDTEDNDFDLSSCISDSENEIKKPPIIVKIPKASLSPTKKNSPKSPKKSPIACFKFS